MFVPCEGCVQNSQPKGWRSGSHETMNSNRPTGVVLIGARWIPGLARPPAPYAIGPNKPHGGSGRQNLVVFLAFGIATASRSTGIVGGCGCTNLLLDHLDEDDVPASEFVTSIRNGHGPCTWRTLNPEWGETVLGGDWQAHWSRRPVKLTDKVVVVTDSTGTRNTKVGGPTSWSSTSIEKHIHRRSTNHLCLGCRACGPGQKILRAHLAMWVTPGQRRRGRNRHIG